MSYAMSLALQEAVYTQLALDVALVGLVGSAIFDAPPTGAPPPLYVLLGTEQVRDRSSKTTEGAMHDFVVKIVSDEAGFAAAKTVGAVVCDALIDANVVLSRGRLISLGFRKARAKRGKAPEGRQIDLTFRAFVEDV